MDKRRRRLVLEDQAQQQLEFGESDPLSNEAPWQDAVGRFLQGCEALGRSPWTAKYYRDRLRAIDVGVPALEQLQDVVKL